MLPILAYHLSPPFHSLSCFYFLDLFYSHTWTARQRKLPRMSARSYVTMLRKKVKTFIKHIVELKTLLQQCLSETVFFIVIQFINLKYLLLSLIWTIRDSIFYCDSVYKFKIFVIKPYLDCKIINTPFSIS